MAKAKKKLLPKNFEELLNEGDLTALKAVFETCEVDARGGYSRRVALAFNNCPDELARWLVGNGADIAATDNYGETPLHFRAGYWNGQIQILLELGADVDAVDDRGDTPLHKAAAVGNPEIVRLLMQHGADIDARNHAGLTPLAKALQQCSNAQIVGITAVAELLLKADARPASGLRAFVGRWTGTQPAPVTPEMRAYVKRIGTDFEFHRAGFDPEMVDEAIAALDRLYQLFDVPPVPRRKAYDGKSPIIARSAGWEAQHQELWAFLVPASGGATTVQGEVVRISGRIQIELEDNGGGNWDADYKKMADAFLFHLGSGVPLTQPELVEAAELIREIKSKRGDPARMCELATHWVALNPQPVTSPLPDYCR